MFISYGYPFRVAHDEPDDPTTTGHHVAELWANFPDAPAMWARVVGLFSNEGEAIMAAKRESALLFNQRVPPA